MRKNVVNSFLEFCINCGKVIPDNVKGRSDFCRISCAKEYMKNHKDAEYVIMEEKK